MNQSTRQITAGAVAAILVCVAVMVYYSNRPGTSVGIRIEDKAYFTTDDGATYFADDMKRTPPFDHNGATAYRVYLFKSDDGKVFPGFLARASDEAIARVQHPTPGANGVPPSDISTADMLVRKPGTKDWVPMDSPQGGNVMNVGPVESVLP